MINRVIICLLMVFSFSIVNAENKWYNLDNPYNIGFKTDGSYLLNFEVDSTTVTKTNNIKVTDQESKMETVIEEITTNIFYGLCGVVGSYICILVGLLILSYLIRPFAKIYFKVNKC